MARCWLWRCRVGSAWDAHDGDGATGRGSVADDRAILAPYVVQVMRCPFMKIVTYSEARSAFKAVLDTVNEDADVTVISRRDGADAVVMSLDHYQSIMETMHLLSTPANAAALGRAVNQDRAGQAKRRQLVQPD